MQCIERTCFFAFGTKEIQCAVHVFPQSFFGDQYQASAKTLTSGTPCPQSKNYGARPSFHILSRSSTCLLQVFRVAADTLSDDSIRSATVKTGAHPNTETESKQAEFIYNLFSFC